MEKRTSQHEPQILKDVREHGFVTFSSGEYNLNIIGVRNLQSTRSNLFDDEIYIVFRVDGLWHEWKAPITTDPGRYYLTKEDYRKDGVAIICHPQQMRGAYKIGPHGKTKYTALRQHKPVQIWRDSNLDDVLDYKGKVYEGIFYVNIHRSSTREGGSKYVDSWSAGCNVFQDPSDFSEFMDLCYTSANIYGDVFTYTLIGK